MSRNKNTAEKRRKELDRKRRAEEKLARRRARKQNRETPQTEESPLETPSGDQVTPSFS